jgi:hypothetical protein
VGRLGEVLELLHDAAQRACPARLTIVEWRHASRSQEAFRRYAAARHRPGTGSIHVAVAQGRGEPAPDETSWTTNLAFDSVTRFREDSAGLQAGKRYLVRDGERWVSWDADWGAMTSDSDESGALSSSYAFLLDPVGIVASFRLEEVGTTEAAGRAALLVRATPRPEPEPTGIVLMQLGAGADVVELALDAERGALLRSEAFVDGEPFHRLEVTEIAFGPIPPETFVPELPAGAEKSAGWSRPRRLPLHELGAAAPFPVFAPARVPEGWRLVESLLTEGRERPPVESRVTLRYASTDGAYSVSITERAAATASRDWLEWTWEQDGEFERADAGEHVVPRHHVRVERQGTLVELAGADPSLCAALARSLARAPTEPPSLEA